MTKKQEYLLIIGLLILIFPFFALILFVHPQVDDFFFAIKVNELGVLPFVKDMYMNWSGRYASMFLGAFDPLRFESLNLHRFELGAYFLLNIFSIFILSKSLFHKGYSNLKLFIYTLIINIIILNSIPDIFEYLYWYPSVTAYQLGLSLILIFIANILFANNKRINKTLYLILNSILAIIIVGLLELYVPLLIIIMIVIMGWNYYKKQRQTSELIILSFIILSSIILVAAPGNYVRMNIANQGSIILSLYLAAKSMIYLMGYLFQNPVFVIANILLFTYSRQLTNNNALIIRLPKINPIWSILLMFIITYLVFLPTTLALKSLPAGRIFNIAAYIFAFLLIYNIFAFQNYYKKIFSFTLPLFYNRLLSLSLVLFMFSGIYVTNPYEFAQKKPGSTFVYGNILNAYKTLFFEAKEFDNDMTARYEYFNNAKLNDQKSLIIKPLEHHPDMLIFADIADIEDPGTWLFNWEAKYYNMDSITIIKEDTIIKGCIKYEINRKSPNNNANN
ncbi:MAG: hypothetical protein B6I18_06770 [Bacteroidetes bacterium 4572_112]|nr:MAG: hypothetical protein B6I18_06770 [Bacteroidetes bacterium 4572_112]